MTSLKDKLDRISELLKHTSGTKNPELVIVDSIYLDQAVSDRLCSRYGLVLEKQDRYKKIPGIKNYEYRIDPPRGIPGPGNLRHVHIFKNGDHVFAMNIDGTAHDGCHQVQIPKEVADFLREIGFKIPKDNLIEMVIPKLGSKQLLCD